MTGALEQSCLHWRSDALPARHRFEAWESALNQSHLPWRLNKGSSGDFQASLGVARLHDLQLVDCVCDPCSGLREGHELGADSQAWFGLLVLFEGAEQVQVGLLNGADTVSTTRAPVALDGPRLRTSIT